MELSTILLILLLHFIGDFILQSDWMAKNKSSSNKALLVHTFVYSLPFTIIGFKYALVNMLLHTIVDFFTSRVAKHFYEKQKIHWFFVVVGFDQMIHYACLFATLGLGR